MKKVFSQISYSWIMLKNSLVRTFLTCIGIVFATALYFGGNIILSSYEARDFRYYENFPESTLLISGCNEGYALNYLDKYSDSSKSIMFLEQNVEIINNQNNSLSLPCRLEGVSEGYEFFSRKSVDKSDSLEFSNLKQGRYITHADLIMGNNVLNIHESFANLLFEGNPLGQSLTINNVDFVVVGILYDTPDVLRTIKMLEKDKEASIALYAPISSVKNNGMATNADYYVVSRFDDVDVSELRNNLQSSNLTITVSESNFVHDRIIDENSDLGMMLNLLLIAIVFISCIIIMITMFFNMKERIFEFGIKMAIGAKKNDIAFSIIVEAFIYSLFGIAIGLVLGLVTSLFFSLAMVDIDGIFIWKITGKNILVSILLPLEAVLIFSLIPALITSSKNIIECLKVE